MRIMHTLEHTGFSPAWFILLLLFCNGAFAGSEPLKNTATVAVEEWPPFRIIDASTPSGFRGIDIDLLTEIEKKTGLHFDVVHMPWARCLECLRTGQADLVTGAAYSKKRAVYMHYVLPAYFSIGPVFYVRKGFARTVSSYADLQGKLIGHSLRSVYFEPFDSDI